MKLKAAEIAESLNPKKTKNGSIIVTDDLKEKVLNELQKEYKNVLKSLKR